MMNRIAIAALCLLVAAFMAPRYSKQSTASAPSDGCGEWVSGQLTSTGEACGSAGGTAVAGDLGDDGNDSNALDEIAIVGNSQGYASIVADKLTLDLTALSSLGYALGYVAGANAVLPGLVYQDASDPPSNGECLKWGTGDVVNWDSCGAGSSDLTGLTDVTLTTPATGAVLVKSGTDWIDGQVDLVDGDAVTGTLPVANGGTGASTLTGVLLGNGTSAVTALASSGTGDVARVTSPSFTTPSLGAATATTASSGDNDTSVATTAFVNTEIAADVPLITTGTADASATCTAGTWYFETDAETLCFCHTTDTQACITMSEAP